MAVTLNGHTYPSGDDPHTLILSDDEILILFEFFERLEEREELRFAHPAEWAALGRLTGQFESTLWQVFSADWEKLLSDARTRRAAGFEGRVPGLGHVRVEADGTVVETPDPDAA